MDTILYSIQLTGRICMKRGNNDSFDGDRSGFMQMTPLKEVLFRRNAIHTITKKRNNHIPNYCYLQNYIPHVVWVIELYREYCGRPVFQVAKPSSIDTSFSDGSVELIKKKKKSIAYGVGHSFGRVSLVWKVCSLMVILNL